MATQGRDGLVKIDYAAMGDDLAARGERRFKSASACCGSASAPREGEKLMTSACDQYRTAGLWQKRATTYAKLVQLLEDFHGIERVNKDAILEYRSLAAQSYAECEMYSEAYSHYRGAAMVAKLKNDYRAAAGILNSLASVQIDAGDKQGAIETLAEGADAYDMANSPTTAAQMLVRRAQLLCDMGNYTEAQTAYLSLLESNKLTFQADTYGLRCQLAALVDMALNPIRNTIESNDERLKQISPTWTRSPERRLIEACYIAYKLGSDGVADFSHACSVFNDTNVLDDWSVVVLLKVKNIMRADASDASDDDSDAKDSDIDLDVSSDDESMEGTEAKEQPTTPKTKVDGAESNSDSDAAVPTRDSNGARLTAEARRAAKDELRKAKATKSRSELFAESLI